MLACLFRRWLHVGAAAVAGVALALAAAAPAAADPPSCSAVLFVPVDGTGAYEVEQPESAAGAIFCGPSISSLEFTIADAPAHGTLSALEANGLGGASFTYTPAAGFAGSDSFALTARDGEGEAVTERVDIVVRLAGNDPPVCSAQLAAEDADGVYRVRSGTAVSGSIDCFDDEENDLTFGVHAAPGHGSLSDVQPAGATAASFTYTPAPGYEGGDTFALVANDGTQDSVPVVVEVTVVPPADEPPHCVANLATASDASGAYEVEQGETVHGAVTCVDGQNAALDFTAGVGPSHGALGSLSASGDGGVDITYTPAPGYLGFDSFRIDASDGVNPATGITVRVRVVAARNDPPTCTADLLAPVVDGAYSVRQGATVGGELNCEDDEGAPLSYAIASPPGHGSVTSVDENGHFSYTAVASYVGQDELALKASDGANDSEPVVVDIAVGAAVDEPPNCEVALGVGANAEGAYLVERESEVQGRIVCSDDGDAEIELTLAVPPGHGSVSALEHDGPASATFTYSPASGYVGPDAFTLAADDGTTPPRQATVGIQVVEPGANVPHCRARLNTANSDAGYEVESGETVAGTLTCFDPDGSPLSFSVARAPGHGSIAGLKSIGEGAAQFTYTADGAWTGSDSFALVANNGTESSNVVDVDVVVVPPVDDPPVCTVSLFSERLLSGAYPAREGEANPGVVACTDDEGAPLTFSVANQPQHGAITNLQADDESAMFEYMAEAGPLGPDTVSISARDPAGGEDVVTLELELVPPANTAPTCSITLDAPLAPGGSYQVEAGSPTAGEIVCEDGEHDQLGFSVVQPPSHGSLSALVGSGDTRSFSYTAVAGYGGADQFALKANDGSKDSEPVNVGLQVKVPDETPSGDSSQPGQETTSTPPPAPTTASCTGQGQALSHCLLEQRVERVCGGLNGKRKAICAKRIRALAKCDAITAKGKPGRRRKKACKKRAQAIGKPHKPRSTH